MVKALRSLAKAFAELIRITLAASLIAFALAQPVQAEPDPAAFNHVWYVPEPVDSIDQAANTITNLQTFMTVYSGIRIDRIVITRDGLAIHAKATSVQKQSDYVPSSGGSWIGSTYVPYFGGSTVTSYVPVTSESQAYISFKGLDAVYLLYFPNRPYKWGVHFQNSDPAKNVTLRTSDEGLARQFANASVTLARPINPSVIEDPRLLPLLGFDFLLDDHKDAMKAAKKAKWTRGGGILVIRVSLGGPAEAAGLRTGDIVFEIDGQPISRSIPVAAVLTERAQSRLGFPVELKVWRNKAEVPLRIDVKNWALAFSLARVPRHLGIAMRDPTPEEIARAGLAGPAGAYINWTVEGQKAERMTMRKGDLIIEINGKPVANSEGLSKILDEGPVTVAKVIRDGTTLELKAPVDAAPHRPQPFGLSVRDLPASGEQPARLEVVAVTAGSPAAKLDLRQADILIEANGKPTRSTGDLGAILAAGPVTTAKVERAGKVVTLGGGAVTSF